MKGEKQVEPDNKALVTAMSVQMHVEVISYGKGQLRGELHSRYLEAPYVFTDLMHMIHKMEEVFDTKGFPEAFLTPRSFIDEKHGNKRHHQDHEVRDDIMNPKTMSESEGLKCTFEITVRFRQNATWQGQIHWAEKNLKQNFRSVLEMLKLMDEALMENVGDTQQIEWNTEK